MNYTITKEFVQNEIDNIFLQVAQQANLKFGDISPEQVAELENITEKLTKIINNYIKNNK